MAEKQEAKGLLTSESGNSAPIPQNSPPVVVTKAEVGDIAEKTYEKLLSKTAIGIIVWVLAIILSFIVGNLFVITKDMYGKIHELNGRLLWLSLSVIIFLTDQVDNAQTQYTHRY